MAWLLGAALAIAGCDDRRAGTEVGNPEITVTARSSIFNDYDSVEVSSLQLMMMGMDYLFSGKNSVVDSGACWKYPGGTLVNLADDYTTLKDTSVEDGHWSRTDIVLRAPDGAAGLPKPADIRTWENPRYVKFNYIRESQRDTLPALFEWPQGMEIRLVFGPAQVDTWRWAGEIWVPFQFFAAPWGDALNTTDRTWTFRQDGLGARYILFSPSENPGTWADLKARLPDCFSADSVIIR
jgi:hypothetical protein